jgi:hypothetical protein
MLLQEFTLLTGRWLAPFAAEGQPADVHVQRVAPERRLIKNFRQAEFLAAEWMTYMGFGHVQVTAATRDGGIDVVATEAVAQVKAESFPTSAPPLQALYGVATAEGKLGLFFSLAGYRSAAISWAGRTGLALFEFELDGGVSGANAAARALLPDPSFPRGVEELATGDLTFGGGAPLMGVLRTRVGIEAADAWASACAALDLGLLAREGMRRQMRETYVRLRVTRIDPLGPAGRALLSEGPPSILTFTIARDETGQVLVAFSELPETLARDPALAHRAIYSVAAGSLADVPGGLGLLQQVLFRRLDP